MAAHHIPDAKRIDEFVAAAIKAEADKAVGGGYDAATRHDLLRLVNRNVSGGEFDRMHPEHLMFFRAQWIQSMMKLQSDPQYQAGVYTVTLKCTFTSPARVLPTHCKLLSRIPAETLNVWLSDHRQKIGGPTAKMKHWLSRLTPDEHKAFLLIQEKMTNTWFTPRDVLSMTGSNSGMSLVQPTTSCFRLLEISVVSIRRMLSVVLMPITHHTVHSL